MSSSESLREREAEIAHGPIDWKAAGSEALGFFKDLLRIDTTNPPGNERPAADSIAAILRREGFDVEIIESAPTRANLVTRLRGTGKKKPLLLSAHLDVVPADPEHWSHPPFEAIEADGFIWGRGALDMKNMAAMSLETLLLLKRRGVELDRDVIFAAVADEEAGSNFGSLYLAENHPDLVRAEYVLTEAGGATMHVGDQRFYPVQVSEKGICWFELVARGEPGHGSMPHPNNPVVRLAKAIDALGTTRLPQHTTPIVEGFFRDVASTSGFPTSALLPLLLNGTFAPALLRLLERVDVSHAIALNAMLRNTVSPTGLKAGKKVNVIPSEATALLDGRVIPGETLESFLAEIRGVVGDDLEIRIVEHHEGSVFDAKTELFELIRDVLHEEDPAGRTIPTMIPGFTDAFAYAKLGATCYGFVPLQLPKGVEFARLYHGHDERVPTDGFLWGVRVLHEVVHRFCAKP